MQSLPSKVGYLARCVASSLSPAAYRCGNCGGGVGAVVDRKYGVTQLRRCRHCHILYRTPVDPPYHERFYSEDYTEGATTHMPDAAELARLVATGFRGCPLDYTYYISVLRGLGLGEGARVFDFGCSWGYGSWQLARAGYAVTSLEIGRGRRAYAIERLGLAVASSLDEVTGPFDCVFSAHVLEHLPKPSAFLEQAARLLAPGGLFVAFVPNGSAAARAANPDWSRAWGQVHPYFLDDLFLARQFPTARKLLASSPFTARPIGDYGLAAGEARVEDLSRFELAFVAAM